MNIDESKIIIREPIYRCSSCDKELCNGDCWVIIRLAHFIQELFTNKINPN